MKKIITRLHAAWLALTSRKFIIVSDNDLEHISNYRFLSEAEDVINNVKWNTSWER